MGGFHMAKAAMLCVGKYLRGSGIEDAFVETEAFRLKVVQSVMEGSHYVRAFRGLLIAAEAVKSMKWDVFWNVHNSEEYTIDQSALSKLSSSLMEKDPFTAKTYLNSCRRNEKLMHNFHSFIIKALIGADRTGDWEGHLDAVENLLSIFRRCENINYLRYATFYLESMRRLPTDHQAICEMFMKG